MFKHVFTQKYNNKMSNITISTTKKQPPRIEEIEIEARATQLEEIEIKMKTT